MYVTRPLSMYKQNPAALSLPPLEGPNSGYLVIQDAEAEPRCCFGLMRSNQLKELPFPQSKLLTTKFLAGEVKLSNDVILIPVLNQPLSSNRYYAIKPHGKRKGEAYTNSKKEDMATCCFFKCVSDAKPQPFDSKNIYQQVEIYRKKCGGFSSKSVASDGFPPEFLRRNGWFAYTKTTCNKIHLTEASGVDPILRGRLPDFNLPLSEKFSKPVVVGKWYCPFMFIKEGTPREQVSTSLYYEMTLEQAWEQIYSCDNNNDNQPNDAFVFVDARVKTGVVSIYRNENSNGGQKADINMVDGVLWFRSFSDVGSGEVSAGLSMEIIETGVVKTGVVSIYRNENSNGGHKADINMVDGVLWFRSFSDVGSGEVSAGLSMEIIERMKWEEERFGWVRGSDGEVKISKKKRIEEFGEGVVSEIGKSWKKFGCYVLVERFVLKRMDGTLVLSYGFRHANQIRSKWE